MPAWHDLCHPLLVRFMPKPNQTVTFGYMTEKKSQTASEKCVVCGMQVLYVVVMFILLTNRTDRLTDTPLCIHPRS